MTSTTAHRQTEPIPVALSIPATLAWLGVLAFCGRWFWAWSEGRLAPGTNTSWEVLLGFFLVAVLLSAVGLYLSVCAWRGKTNVKWQAASLIGAAVLLWAVSGG